MRNEHLIMHAEIIIGGCTIMLAYSTDSFARRTAGLFIYVTNAVETYEKTLHADATSITPPATQSYSRSCGIIDPFGNTLWPTSVPE